MEEEFFNKIRSHFCSTDSNIAMGKMMSSEAIVYKDKVFAFFSRKKKMVFKLGKDFNTENVKFEITVFNPFKKRPPLSGWYEVAYSDKEQWEQLTNKALTTLKKEL